MKKVILMILAIVLTVSTVLSVTGFAMAEDEPSPVEAVAVRAGLVINAPAIAKAGEPLRIQIVTRPGERPVSQAEVWVVDIDDTSDVALTADAASLRQCNGRLLGTTNDRGYVYPPPSMGKSGKYLLAATKPSFDPGFAMIKITQKIPLTLRAPDTGVAGRPVNMQATDPNGQGVYRAAMFAIPLLRATNDTTTAGDYDRWLKDAEVYAETMESPTSNAKVGEETESWDQIGRYFIGFTDRNGEISHRFSQCGPYLLIAAKRGYIPDFQIIKIIGLETATPEKLTPVQVEEVTISLKSK